MNGNRNYIGVYIAISFVMEFLTVVMVILRCTGAVMIPWWIVLSPIWAMVVFVVIVLAIVIFIAAVRNIKYNTRSKYITKDLHKD